MATQQSRTFRLAFLAEWFQIEAALIRTYVICFYPYDNAIEIIDPKSTKTFLQRTKMPDFSERDFYLGSKFNIFGRLFEVVDFGNIATRRLFSKYRKTFFLMKYSARESLGEILCGLVESNVIINNVKMVKMRHYQIKVFLLNNNESETRKAIITHQLMAGPCIGFELVADNLIERLSKCILRRKCSEPLFPHDFQLLLGDKDLRAGIYASPNEAIAEMDLNFFFGPNNRLEISCNFGNTVLAVIKPHSIKAGNMGKIVKEIMDNKFQVTGVLMDILDRSNCEEFYKVYRGLIPEYIPLFMELSSGKCLALEICHEDKAKNSHKEFSAFCGPMDPEMAKILRPNSLRAKYGRTKTFNGIHSTYLEDDADLELQYFFRTLP